MKTANKDRVKFLYRLLLRMGKMESAFLIFKLLHNGTITLGLDDASWEAELALEQVLKPHYSRNGNTCRFRLEKPSGAA